MLWSSSELSHSQLLSRSPSICRSYISMAAGTGCSSKSLDSDPMESCKGMQIEGYPIKGLSIGGHETCVIFPTLSLAFDIGRCPQKAISQDFLFISHGHMDHIGGLPLYVATRGLYKMKPPTIIVPKSIKNDVENLLEVHRRLDQSELRCNLIGLEVGEELSLRRDLKVRAFKTYHVIDSQGYLLYSVKQKLKKEYLGLSGNEIKKLRLSGAESTFLENRVTVEHAREYGHTHLFEIINHAEKFKNKAILLIHFSARYTTEEIQQAIATIPPPLAGRVSALMEGF
ncbi:nuclear ribonuclease Z isoform X3 [Benincasa hispida]|uniref:nuclear ribonuclease Z isoform X3 n=1 Tax=Benincasa hispida TaxID=102211 RepID=UPI001902512F|nr:nuclear ribonuclease Z isoform X3 [Benincasa hispida]